MTEHTSLSASRDTRGQQIAAYVADASARSFPIDVIDAAKRALVDFVGKAAMDGILAAQLAADGFVAATTSSNWEKAGLIPSFRIGTSKSACRPVLR